MRTSAMAAKAGNVSGWVQQHLHSLQHETLIQL
jgi:hypothetical protein